MKRGLFITFEGMDGSGKTTQIDRAAAFLRSSGHSVVQTREPGGTRVGEALRAIVVARRDDRLSGLTELFIMAAARAHHVEQVIRPALDAGKIVLCDRYSDSTIAYQHAARGLPLEQVASTCKLAEQGIAPDHTIFFDLEEAEAARRRSVRSAQGGESTFDAEARDFHLAVRRGYTACYTAEPNRIVLVDASADIESVWQLTRNHLASFLDGRP